MSERLHTDLCLMACLCSKDTDQPVHSRRSVRILTGPDALSSEDVFSKQRLIRLRECVARSESLLESHVIRLIPVRGGSKFSQILGLNLSVSYQQLDCTIRGARILGVKYQALV